MNNSSIKNNIPDIQNTSDQRDILIHQVGIRKIKYPITLKTTSGIQQIVGNFDLSVSLNKEKKGTHMSRFVALLESKKNIPFDIDALSNMTIDMIELLDSTSGRIRLNYIQFIEKHAPVSGISSLMDYDITWEVTIYKEKNENKLTTILFLIIPVTTLCPCSKAISKYNAHNQRSHITLKIELEQDKKINIENLIKIVESEASCELWGLLKRSDEKYVTEYAYDHPKLVEDLARDVFVKMKTMKNIKRYSIDIENFESIHNHSAYAYINSDSI